MPRICTLLALNCAVGLSSLKSFRFAVLAAALFAIVLPRAVAGTVTVEIFSGFDVTNGPTGMPFTDYKGSFVVPHTAFYNYDFGHPFGLNTFAAKISFSMYMSDTGYYIGGHDSNSFDGSNWFSAPIYWTEGYPNYYQNEGSDWMSGLGVGEAGYEKGITNFELLYIGLPSPIPGGPGPNAGMVGGGPHRLTIYFPHPWGGDPRVDHGAYSFVVVPDSIGTLGGTFSAMLVLLGLRRKGFRGAV